MLAAERNSRRPWLCRAPPARRHAPGVRGGLLVCIAPTLLRGEINWRRATGWLTGGIQLLAALLSFSAWNLQLQGGEGMGAWRHGSAPAVFVLRGRRVPGRRGGELPRCARGSWTLRELAYSLRLVRRGRGRRADSPIHKHNVAKALERPDAALAF